MAYFLLLISHHNDHKIFHFNVMIIIKIKIKFKIAINLQYSIDITFINKYLIFQIL